MTSFADSIDVRRPLQLWEAIGTELAGTGYPGIEQRKRQRFLAPAVVCELDLVTPQHGQTVEVAVQDVSASGASLLSAKELPMNQVVRIHPPTNAPHNVAIAEGRVSYCNKTALRYRVGVDFSAG